LLFDDLGETVMSARLISILIPLAVVVGACGAKSSIGPCDTDPPAPECTIQCDPQPGAPNTCPAGYHCSPDGFCDAACTQGGGECGSGRYCTPDGTCEQLDGDANLGPDADCPDVHFTAMPVTPTVQLILDQSGSMTAAYGSTDRWNAMRNALIDPTTGVVANLDASVVFGATLYSGTSADDGTGLQVGIPPCPGLTSRPRALNNYNAIATMLQGASPIEDTPTAPTIDAVIADFAANPPMAGSPPIIVLATDGLPDTCENADPRNAGEQSAANQTAVEAAQRSWAAGIELFYLSVGDDVTDSHAQQMANAGAGLDPATGTATFYRASNPAELQAAFAAIIGGVLSCRLDLDGDVDPTQASTGSVTLNVNTLTYPTDWNLIDPNTIELLGAACDELLASSNPTVTAVFPCGAVIQ
jgi:hypothetical protein